MGWAECLKEIAGATPKSAPLLELNLQVVPRASKTQIVGPHGQPPRLRVRIAAPPVDGEANDEVIRFFSKLLSIPKSQIEMVRGSTGKNKTLRLAGISKILALEQFQHSASKKKGG